MRSTLNNLSCKSLWNVPLLSPSRSMVVQMTCRQSCSLHRNFAFSVCRGYGTSIQANKNTWLQTTHSAKKMLNFNVLQINNSHYWHDWCIIIVLYTALDRHLWDPEFEAKLLGKQIIFLGLPCARLRRRHTLYACIDTQQLLRTRDRVIWAH